MPEHRIDYVDRLVQDGSGNPVAMAGAADLEVVFEGVNAHDVDGTPTVSRGACSPGLPAVKASEVGDFEAVVSYGIGVDSERPITVSTLSGPSRLVVDVSTAGVGGSTSDDGSGSFPSPARGPRSCSSPGSPSWPRSGRAGSGPPHPHRAGVRRRRGPGASGDHPGGRSAPRGGCLALRRGSRSKAVQARLEVG